MRVLNPLAASAVRAAADAEVGALESPARILPDATDVTVLFREIKSSSSSFENRPDSSMVVAPMVTGPPVNCGKISAPAF